MASPRGPRGGVGPGEAGNLIVTGHRLSSSMPFATRPRSTRGDRIDVRSGDTVFVYEVRRTRWTSFRSQESLAAHARPVPGPPGVEATRPSTMLSTCATLEDHAAGNYWSDEFDNPEHRIDKIGALVEHQAGGGRVPARDEQVYRDRSTATGLDRSLPLATRPSLGRIGGRVPREGTSEAYRDRSAATRSRDARWRSLLDHRAWRARSSTTG